MNININIDDISSDDFLTFLTLCQRILNINFKIENCSVNSFNDIENCHFIKNQFVESECNNVIKMK